MHHPASVLQPNVKETPYFSFKQRDIVASHLNKTRNIMGNDDSEVFDLKLNNTFITLYN